MTELPEKDSLASEIDAQAGETSEEDRDAASPESNGGECSRSLREALAKFNVVLDDAIVEKLDEYLDQLWTWNERLNLTRHTSYDKFVARDLIDSMRLAELLQSGERVLDVGSGGGVPGLVVAILRPDVAVDLCESTGKKAKALGEIIDSLGIDLNVWYAKAEDLLKERKYHTLTIRAVGKMRSLLLMFAPVWDRFERMLLVKGPKWVDERGEARHYNMFNKLALRKLASYEIPDEGFESVILQICRKTNLENIERRAREREEGLPYDAEEEPIVVERTPRGRLGGARGRAHSASSGSRERLSARKPDEIPREFMTARDRRSDGSSGMERKARVYARKDGRPPKGWTGKKSEFRAKSGRKTGDGSKGRGRNGRRDGR